MILKCRNVEREASTAAAVEQLRVKGFEPLTERAAAVTDDKAPEDNEKDFSKMTVAELRSLAKAKGISGAAALGKVELLEVLKDVV